TARRLPGSGTAPRPRADPTTPRTPSARSGAVQVSEELAVRLDHQHVVLRADRLAVCLQAAMEGIELGVARIRLGVGLRGQGVALASHDLGLAVRLGKDLGALAVRLGAQLDSVLLTLGAQLLRLPVEVLPHAL